ncbi:hypothetical protein L6452_03668 [Arctium lappa]|uniref:Uncharacterized protein n=1 Tax=Arctium lappa TaxID=4217 RepID=A0ACB9FPI1_ARCLA|nr:hypothetical protein L6452_03668 [Arctium lappa]
MDQVELESYASIYHSILSNELDIGLGFAHSTVYRMLLVFRFGHWSLGTELWFLVAGGRTWLLNEHQSLIVFFWIVFCDFLVRMGVF